jgi:hypothetical protein
MNVVRPAIMHPIALASIVLVAVNDHWAKYAFPSPLTGKLSDIAGLIWFPLLLLALWTLPRWLRDRASTSNRRLAMCIAATGLVFCAINLHPAAADAYAHLLGTLQWLPSAAASQLAGLEAPVRHAVSFTRDPTDLLALPSLWVAWYLGAAPRPGALSTAWV